MKLTPTYFSSDSSVKFSQNTFSNFKAETYGRTAMSFHYALISCIKLSSENKTQAQMVLYFLPYEVPDCS